jgi:phosphonoacetate hydrolase
VIGRRTLLLGAVGQSIRRPPQRVVVVMCDGFGVDYFTASSMPTLARWKSDGLYKAVRGVMPSVTNANNASICCGTADRIGDLAVFGDRDAVFGDLDDETEALPQEYRSHGSPSELDVPLFVFNAAGAPAVEYVEHNFDVARWLYA